MQTNINLITMTFFDKNNSSSLKSQQSQSLVKLTSPPKASYRIPARIQITKSGETEENVMAHPLFKNFHQAMLEINKDLYALGNRFKIGNSINLSLVRPIIEKHLNPFSRDDLQQITLHSDSFAYLKLLSGKDNAITGFYNIDIGMLEAFIDVSIEMKLKLSLKHLIALPPNTLMEAVKYCKGLKRDIRSLFSEDEIACLSQDIDLSALQYETIFDCLMMSERPLRLLSRTFVHELIVNLYNHEILNKFLQNLIKHITKANIDDTCLHRLLCSQDKDGRTPLMLAIIHGAVDVLDTLRDKRVFHLVQSTLMIRDNLGHSPLFYAITLGNEPALSLLLTEGVVQHHTTDITQWLDWLYLPKVLETCLSDVGIEGSRHFLAPYNYLLLARTESSMTDSKEAILLDEKPVVIGMNRRFYEVVENHPQLVGYYWPILLAEKAFNQLKKFDSGSIYFCLVPGSIKYKVISPSGVQVSDTITKMEFEKSWTGQSFVDYSHRTSSEIETYLLAINEQIMSLLSARNHVYFDPTSTPDISRYIYTIKGSKCLSFRDAVNKRKKELGFLFMIARHLVRASCTEELEELLEYEPGLLNYVDEHCCHLLHYATNSLLVTENFVTSDEWELIFERRVDIFALLIKQCPQGLLIKNVKQETVSDIVERKLKDVNLSGIDHQFYHQLNEQLSEHYQSASISNRP